MGLHQCCTAIPTHNQAMPMSITQYLTTKLINVGTKNDKRSQCYAITELIAARNFEAHCHKAHLIHNQGEN